MTPVLFDQATPAGRGEAHGELWRHEIRALADIRITLALKRGAFKDREQLLAVADLHLPELLSAAPRMHEELLGIARGSDLSAAEIVALNHYTDLRDVPPTVLGSTVQGADEPPKDADPGGCTSLFVNGPEGPVLGQTWDMHGTAAEFVRMMRFAPEGSEREVLTFSLTGCLGMTGINERGVGVTINNLSSTDGQVGLVWPALVRRLLEQDTADAARDLLLKARLSSGHHYMIADVHDFHGIETSGAIKVQTQSGQHRAHMHTNHCFDPVLRKYENVSKISTTFRRMELATASYDRDRPETAEELWSFLSSHEGYPKSICSHVDNAEGDPSASQTCGLVVMNLVGGRVLAVRGCPHEHGREELEMTRWRGPTASGGSQ